MTPTSRSIAPEEDSIQRLVLQIVRLLVDDVGAVKVDCVDEGNVTTLNIRVAPSDTGKLVGRQGSTVRSLRTIISAASMKLHHRYNLTIEEGHP